MAKKNITVNNDTEISAEEKKKLDATRIFLVIFAAITAVSLLATFIIALIPKGSSAKTLDYLKDDLSKYVEVPAEVYTNYAVTVELPKVSDRDVEYEILNLLCANKIKGDKLPVNLPNVTISAGDVANIYYRGYILNEDGSRKYFDGGCNFADTTTALEIGSGSFIAGFEYNLVGKNQKDYAKMTKHTEGNTEAGDIISLTYSVYYADGQASLTKTAMIDLGDPKLDETWGEGFQAYFTKEGGVAIGEQIATGSENDDKLSVPTTKKTGNSADIDIYFDMQVSEVYRYGEGEVLDIEAYFPHNYGDELLNGKTAHFEVFIKSVQDFEVKEFNDEFVTETLKKTAEDLASYEGATVTEKYRSYIWSTLEEEYEANVRSVIESQLWKTVIAGSTYKKLPENEVQAAYENYVYEIQSTYANGYSSYYSSVDEFARAYLELGSTGDWKAKLRSDAEYSIKQKLSFYYIIRELDLVPNDEEYKAVYDELFAEQIQAYMDYYGYTKDDANYASKVEIATNEILAAYGESYWRESVIYEFAIDALIDRANVTYKNV